MKEPELRDIDRLPASLDLCYGCMEYIHAGTTTCAHCGGDIARSRRQEAIIDLRRLIANANTASAAAAPV